MKLYKHSAYRDIALEIKKRYYIKEKDKWKIKVHYWCRIPCTDQYEPMNIFDSFWCDISKLKVIDSTGQCAKISAWDQPKIKL